MTADLRVPTLQDVMGALDRLADELDELRALTPKGAATVTQSSHPERSNAMHHTATLTAVTTTPSRQHGAVYSLHVTCDRCGRNNLHGGGTDPALLATYLGHRVSHCGCPGGYIITDPNATLGQVSATISAAKARRDEEAR